jgi:hypothetical protein
VPATDVTATGSRVRSTALTATAAPAAVSTGLVMATSGLAEERKSEGPKNVRLLWLLVWALLLLWGEG